MSHSKGGKVHQHDSILKKVSHSPDSVSQRFMLGYYYYYAYNMCMKTYNIMGIQHPLSGFTT